MFWIIVYKSKCKQGGNWVYTPSNGVVMERHEIDLDDLINATESTLEFFESKGLDSLKCYELLYGVLKLSKSYIESGANSLALLFDAIEICNSSDNPKKDYESAKDFVKSHQKNLNTHLNKHKVDYYEFLKKKECLYSVFIDSTIGEGNHRNNFFINIQRINAESREVDAKISHDIAYTVSSLPKPLPWAKPFLNLEVTGWKFLTYIGFPLFNLLYFTILVFWNLYGFSSLSATVLIISTFAVASFFHWIYPIYEAMDKRVGIAPFWMLNLNVISAQLRANKLGEKKEDGKQYRILELVVYKANCPVCGNVVSVVAGKSKFKGRLIGECDESPREHIFSFDHTKKIGNRI